MVSRRRGLGGSSLALKIRSLQLDLRIFFVAFFCWDEWHILKTGQQKTAGNCGICKGSWKLEPLGFFGRTFFYRLLFHPHVPTHLFLKVDLQCCESKIGKVRVVQHIDMDTLVDATYDYVMPRTPFGVAIAAECCVIATGINTRVKDWMPSRSATTLGDWAWQRAQ